jgi:hypothetical protein
MKRHCHYCNVTLRLTELRCPYCRRSAMSWLQIGGITAVALTAAVYLFRGF